MFIQMKERIKLPQVAIFALILCSILLLSAESVHAASFESATSKKVSFSELQDGEEVILVCNYYSKDNKKKIVTADTTGNYILPADIHIDNVGDSLTAIPDWAAVFRVEKQSDVEMRLRCGDKYLCAKSNGAGYSENADEYSLWTIEEGNNKVHYLSNSGRYLEYYSSYSDFTTNTYDRNPEKINDHSYQFLFYRVSGYSVGGYTLPLFETSDVHGNLAEVTENPIQYRMAYIADKVNDAREGDAGRTLLLDGGIFFKVRQLQVLH